MMKAEQITFDSHLYQHQAYNMNHFLKNKLDI